MNAITTTQETTEKKTYTPAEIKDGYFLKMKRAAAALKRDINNLEKWQAYQTAKKNYITIIEGYENLT